MQVKTLLKAAFFLVAANAEIIKLGPRHQYTLRDLPSDPTTPSQHRLAYSNDDGMAVSWNTIEQLARPSVQYGLSPSNLDQTASSDISITYQTSSTYNNHVKITGLKPHTTYYYKVANDDEVYQFTTARSAGSDFEEFTFAAVVDLGTMGSLGLSETTGKGAGGALAPGEQNTIESLKKSLDTFEFLVHPGDIAYADYWLKEEIQGYLANTTIHDGYKVYEDILNEFYEQMQPVTAVKPYMVGIGNHEADCDNGGTSDKANNIKYTNSICMPGQTNFTGYNHHFNMPGEESGGNNFWYSFNYGPLHIVHYNTETDFGNGREGPEDLGVNGKLGRYPNEQIDWLQKDLSSVNRTETPWVIALGHRPWYVAAKKSDRCTLCQTVFEDILTENNVDLVVNGHVHNYERLTPIKNNQIDPNGLNNPSSPWYILNGIAGHYDGLDPLVDPLPEYVAFSQDTDYGWSRFTVHNCTHLTHEFISSQNNTVLDRSTLFKDRVCKKDELSSSVSPSASSSAPSSSAPASNSASSSEGSSSSEITSSGSGSSLIASDSGSSSGLYSTKTDHHTTIVTITSCSDHKCTETTSPAIESVATTTVNGVVTEYTTYCPILGEESATESTAPESTAPESTAPESTAPESTAPESTGPESTAPESTAPESTAPESTAPESTAPESTGPESTAPESTVPESTGPESTGPESTAPESTGPESTGPESTGPESTGPESVSPESTGPESAASSTGSVPQVSTIALNKAAQLYGSGILGLLVISVLVM